MIGKICYMGDGTLDGAAAYLAGVMNHFGLAYDHARSDAKPDEDFPRRPYALYVLSDYPSANLSADESRAIVERVRTGAAGFLMIGGWESFHGRLGEYVDSPLAEALPVVMAREDDRRNCPQPCLINKVRDHEMLEGLPFETPPCVGGFNAFTPKNGSETILTAIQFRVQRRDGEFQFHRGEETPLLVLGALEKGRTAALATDVAPHWIGGFVDWGDQRLTTTAGEGFVEVGNWYARFFRNLLTWAGRLSERNANDG